jgi:hypothetical protein
MANPLDIKRRAARHPDRPGERCAAPPGKWIPVIYQRHCDAPGGLPHCLSQRCFRAGKDEPGAVRATTPPRQDPRHPPPTSDRGAVNGRGRKTGTGSTAGRPASIGRPGLCVTASNVVVGYGGKPDSLLSCGTNVGCVPVHVLQVVGKLGIAFLSSIDEAHPHAV